jgi:hypothetical protein
VRGSAIRAHKRALLDSEYHLGFVKTWWALNSFATLKSMQNRRAYFMHAVLGYSV